MEKGDIVAGRYRIKRMLGEGGMGKTLLAKDQVLGRKVVIKRPFGDHERFEREAKAQAALNHTNIVKVYDYGVDSGTPYLIMEWIAGWDLNGLIKYAGRLSPERANYIIRMVCQAAAHAHVFGIVHRDIKPHNILIGSDDIPRLADFGIAKLPSHPLTSPGHGMGTPVYIAPEQEDDAKNVDARADIYALGMTLAAMLSGKPFPENLNLQREVPPMFHDVITRCLKRDPNNRFDSVEALLEALPPLDRGQRQLSNMTGTATAIKVIKEMGAVPVRKKDHVELAFNLGEERLSGKGKLRTILGYCYMPEKKVAGYVVHMHEVKKYSLKRAPRALTEYSPSVRIDEEVVSSLIPL